MKNNIVFPLLFVMLAMSNSNCAWGPRDDQSGDRRTDSNGNKELFEAEAKEYESEDRVIWQKPDLVIQQLGDVEGKVVADIGAGTGYFSRRIAYKGATVIAIDIDPKAIRWMEEQKKRFPLELQDRLIIRLAEPDDPKLKSHEVDLILLVNTYSYIQDRVTYFQKLKETIRPQGGMVIIDFKKKETPFGPPIEERIDVKEVEKELKEAGYVIQQIDEESLEYQYMIKVRRE